MKLTFHGAARTVTGSKHLISLDNGTNILLDCGMFQGMGQKTDDLNEHFGFDPKSITYLLLSHAHIDHTGLIPKLVKEGFTGKIYCTPATRDLTEILLFDSAEIQTYEVDNINKRRAKKNLQPYEPLYTSNDVAATLPLFELVDYDTWFDLSEEVSFIFTNTGHLIGSAAITLKIKDEGKERIIAFSGDVGRQRSVLLPSPVPLPQADYLILESTYGDSRHDISFNIVKTLRQWVEKTCVERGGKLVIPAFSVGRTQEILYGLNQLSLEKRLPELNYYIDSPLSLKATETIKKYTDLFNERLQQVLRIDDDPFHFEGLKYVESVEDSRRLVDHQEPCVIISASGTADAGRVRHHINSIINDEKNSVLFVGYCSEQSLGGQLLTGYNEVEIFGDPSPVKAEIGRMAGMSAHGDCDELSQFLSEQDPGKVKRLFLVHGEYTVQKEFAAKLERKGYQNVEIPSPHQSFEV
ncbi:MBL fold metallo-hydrolase [Flavisolibacter tropicus]|uniref:Metallo-beta-lactamase n=1 Tax=Flavisolibacter tropicus TaxID=1492898 RepID=A0A172TST5_9BACT|nr:MBL fold metallo-hydrolase [Flavisolibacter tropicus]ANE50038.1 metallo-beta-lactamase [Flavisolibacter tropicus]